MVDQAQRIVVTVCLAAVVAVAIVLVLPTGVLYPRYCAPGPVEVGAASQGTEFCIDYDPVLGRYENPPRDVPTDVSARATSAANPNLVRAAVGVGTFLLAFGVIWVIAGYAVRSSARFDGAADE